MSKEKNFLSPKQLESQEHLSLEWLSSLKVLPKYQAIDLSDRPIESFIELMKWVEKKFSPLIVSSSDEELNRFVHNRIIVDGQFIDRKSVV